MWPRVGKHGWERRAMLGVKVDVMRLRQGMRARARERATNAVFKNGVPEKMTDPKSFTVPCSIGDVDLGCTLCDLGASINLMPLSIFKKLGLGRAQPKKMALQLARQIHSAS
ncbi:uncharacterized protein E6C27_scaffold135G002260 [Cucumis melo var. makuwa]|uniref:Aspartic peptidase DDI1-type domain-containing protein n=1 Tax=Cucumis melo var. makuwa TaxID=1194695 RepID=A0A5A7UHV2_CUCMM|nr:uncharacterized protein E6C27_scaffold135G002260 [Cucumis melo var. makuwa]